jgi:putative Mg2+ transporter-C (MgtC) family protein
MNALIECHTRIDLVSMEITLDDLFHIPDSTHVVRVVVRIFVAALLGGILGAERERAGRAAGLRTHMLVAVGCALFVLSPAEAGMAQADLSRVIQGVATGIGFIGAGTILKRPDSDEVQGLTTAANLWLTAAIGLAVGAGQLWLPVISVASAWVILSLLRRFNRPQQDGS